MAVADYLDTVQKIYIAFYQRPADPTGLKYWAQRVDAAHGSLSEVIDAFANSAEATSLYGTIDATNIGGVIDAIYAALFNRPADAEGKQFYTDAFNAGTITAGNIALAVLDGAQNNDLVAISNKLGVANEFTAQVDGRPLSDALFGTGTNFNVTYDGDADAAAARTFLAGVTYSPSTVLGAAGVTEALQASIADANDPISSQVSGQTYTLTQGADDLTGTTGNDTFVANQVLPVGSSTMVDTLNSTDLINGGAGNDILKATISANVTATTTSVETVQIRNVDSSLHTVAIAKDVTSVVEANSANPVTFTGAAGVTSVTSGGAKALTVNGLEAAAVSVKVADANNTVTLASNAAKTAALTSLNVEFNGTLTVAAQNTSIADTVKTLAVKATGAGTYNSTTPANNTADSLTFANTSELTTATVTGTGDVELGLGASQAKLTSFDASGLAGGAIVSLDGGASSVLATVKGGSGNDVLTVAKLKDGATVDLGAGDNQLNVNTAKGAVTVTGGAGADNITLDANVAGKATVINTGAGDDKVTITTADYTTASTTLAVNLGNGNDFVNAGDLTGALSTVTFDGGAGTDTIRITNAFGLAEANRISNFEVVDVTGNANGLDLSREASFNAVTIDGSVTDADLTAAKVFNAAAGTTITAKNGDAGKLSYALADDTGTSDSVSVTLSADDHTNKTGTAGKDASLALTANNIETINVASTANPGVDDAATTSTNEALKASDYTNTLTLSADSAKTVAVTGDAKLDLTISATTTSTAAKLATIDATGNNGGVTVTSYNTNAVTFNGGAGDDAVTSKVGGMVIKGGAGADSYDIAQANDVKDTIVVAAQGDSFLTTKANATTGATELDTSKLDTILSFGAYDKLDLTAFGFTGSKAGDFAEATISTTNSDLLGLVKNGQTDFFKTGSVYAGVAEFGDNGQTYLAVDANKDGNFNAAQDAVIEITGVASLDAAQVVWAA